MENDTDYWNKNQVELLKWKMPWKLDIRNSVDGFQSGLDTARERFSELEDMSEEIFWKPAQRDKEVKKLWKRLSYVEQWNSNICFPSVLEEGEGEIETEQYLKS